MTQLTNPYGHSWLQKNRNCLEQIHVMRRVMEAYYQCQLSLIAVCIDFKKVFDSIDIDMMQKILKNQGISRIRVRLGESRVRLNEKLSEAFQITTGVLLGDTHTPLLFIFVIRCILKETDPYHGIKTHLPNSDVSLSDLDFADYIVSFDSNETAAGEHLQNLQKEAATDGLKINSDKTKILLVNYQFSNQLP